MKIGDAIPIYREQRKYFNEQVKNLAQQRDKAQQRYRITGDKAYAEEAATLELSLNEVREKQEENQKVLDDLAEQRATAFNAEVSKQQADAVKEWGENMGKIMTTVARMCAGDKVPASDEKKVMDYDSDLYMKAKSAQTAMMAMKKRIKEYDSLWEEEEERTEYDPDAAADNAEAALPVEDIALGEGVVDATGGGEVSVEVSAE